MPVLPFIGERGHTKKFLSVEEANTLERHLKKLLYGMLLSITEL